MRRALRERFARIESDLRTLRDAIEEANTRGRDAAWLASFGPAPIVDYRIVKPGDRLYYTGRTWDTDAGTFRDHNGTPVYYAVDGTFPECPFRVGDTDHALSMSADLGREARTEVDCFLSWTPPQEAELS